MRSLNVVAYGQGIMYSNLTPHLQAIREAGWNSIILGMLHPHADGNIYFGNTLIMENGEYKGHGQWSGQLDALLRGRGSTVKQLLAGIGGGWPVADFANIKSIYEENGRTFDRTNLKRNFEAFHRDFPMVTALDMDMEETYDHESFVAFCQMLIKMGFGITFCPYMSKEFWAGALKALNESNPGAVKWWNLQCYDGGQGNNPRPWAEAITAAIPDFDTAGFIIPGDWSRHAVKPGLDPSTWYWQGDCPAAVQSLMTPFAKEASVGGGFIWTIDQILNYAEDARRKPDPAPCGAVGMPNYVAAITKGLGGSGD
jgi:hypothetical protein